MDDKIRLLMEESGCDRSEAELALRSAGYDLEKAIRTIPTLLKNIVVVKARFRDPGVSLFGLFLIIIDTKHKRLFRVKAVASYNPSLYETALAQDWYDFERRLYGFRLMEGAHPSITKDLEVLLNDLWSTQADVFLTMIKGTDVDALSKHLREFLGRKLQWGGLQLDLTLEELNLAQFQHLKKDWVVPGSSESATSRTDQESYPAPLSVQVEFESDSSGVPVDEIKPGDMVFSLISDERDIAKYLGRLLGSRSGGVILGLPTPVEGLEKQGDSVQISVRLTTGIIGRSLVSAGTCLRTQHQSTLADSWWKRLLTWNHG